VGEGSLFPKSGEVMDMPARNKVYVHRPPNKGVMKMKNKKAMIKHKKEMTKMMANINSGLAFVFDLKTFGTISYINKMNAGSVSLVMADFLKDLTKK